ncbi:MAG: helix-turn-helix transcriptional regulator [Gemmatimonadetes bacterium]|nr:helix-turn-helix transcriptional regulator [Gemmatimonadota bacterium]MYD13216.1 helix-turn-helix transcriptional regulator [Gemmatimonadota bacterium]MYI66622.1 helix-turn-helix transcriptional regulator [Gemmatimonadota bacterium]
MSEVTRTPPPGVADAAARLGMRIRAERIRRGLTQRELADRMGVSRFW